MPVDIFCVLLFPVLQAMPLEPKINNRIRKALKSHIQSGVSAGAILRLEEFYEFLLQHVSNVIDKEDLASLTTLLDMQADVRNFLIFYFNPTLKL